MFKRGDIIIYDDATDHKDNFRLVIKDSSNGDVETCYLWKFEYLVSASSEKYYKLITTIFRGEI